MLFCDWLKLRFQNKADQMGAYKMKYIRSMTLSLYALDVNVDKKLSF